jgi:hypothetical protein
MRNLVRRYVTQEQRKAENEGVTEDDVNEIKNDISAFRFELIEIMRASGMNTQSATGPSGVRTLYRAFFRLISIILRSENTGAKQLFQHSSYSVLSILRQLFCGKI